MMKHSKHKDFRLQKTLIRWVNVQYISGHFHQKHKLSQHKLAKKHLTKCGHSIVFKKQNFVPPSLFKNQGVATPTNNRIDLKGPQAPPHRHFPRIFCPTSVSQKNSSQICRNVYFSMVTKAQTSPVAFIDLRDGTERSRDIRPLLSSLKAKEPVVLWRPKAPLE